jgi:polar amino acid transport system permease protein
VNTDFWQWSYFWKVFPGIIGEGLWITFQATVYGSVIAYVLGLVFALLRRSRFAAVRGVVWAIIEFIRSTPLLVQIFFLFYVFPDFGIKFEPLTTGVIALGLHYATYAAEVYRAGIEAVPPGQWEAATALSLPRSRTWRAVILPQAIPRVLPALGNYSISMLKETPLLLTISVVDIAGSAFQQGSSSFRYVEPITVAGILFLVLSLAASLLVRWLERRVGTVH